MLFVLEQGKLRAVSADGRDPIILHPEFMPLSTESEDGTDTDSGNAAGADDANVPAGSVFELPEIW